MNNVTSKKSAPIISVLDFVGESADPPRPVQNEPWQNKSWFQEPGGPDEELAELEKIKDMVFLPNWGNKPVEQPATLLLNEVPVLTHQNTMVIIAPPGAGKSSICEAVMSNYLNKNVDCLGIKVNEACKGIISIDFERTNIDVWNSFYRAAKRAKLSHGSEIKDLVFAGMRSVPRLKERLQAIKWLLDNNQCDLLILDGAGDMVTDTNDLPQAIECRIFLRELTVKYDLSILTTLHPNPGSLKPRGHIGSEMLREAESALIVKDIEGNCKLLTTDFIHGKNRNSSEACSAYKWNEEQKMFLSANINEMRSSREDAKDKAKMEWTREQAEKALPPLSSLKYNDLISAIMKTIIKSEASAKRVLKDMVGWGFIEKGEDSHYRLTV